MNDFTLKFHSGDHVFLFNSISLSIEEDDVYGALFLPVPVPGVLQDSGKSIKEKLEAGQLVMKQQYQLCQHQGVVDADILFGTREECIAFYAEFFNRGGASVSE